MPSYDRSVSPPAPIADVFFVNPATGLRTELVRGKLDTGAAVTVIPEDIVVALELVSHGEVWARSYDGSYSQQPLYYVALMVAGFSVPPVRCLAARRETALIGRNVLNRFVITLDGKNLTFEMSA